MKIIKIIIGENERELLFNISDSFNNNKIPSVYFVHDIGFKSNNRFNYIEDHSIKLINIDDQFMKEKFDIINNSLSLKKEIKYIFLNNDEIKKKILIKNVIYKLDLIDDKYIENLYLLNKNTYIKYNGSGYYNEKYKNRNRI